MTIGLYGVTGTGAVLLDFTCYCFEAFQLYVRMIEVRLFCKAQRWFDRKGIAVENQGSTVTFRNVIRTRPSRHFSVLAFDRKRDAAGQLEEVGKLKRWKPYMTLETIYRAAMMLKCRLQS